METILVTLGCFLKADYFDIYKKSNYVAENLALHKPAYQSSIYRNYIASNAVNGLLYGINEYSETQGGDNQWWRVDLGSVQSVKLIELYGRNARRKFAKSIVDFDIFKSDKFMYLH